MKKKKQLLYLAKKNETEIISLSLLNFVKKHGEVILSDKNQNLYKLKKL